MGWGWYLFSGIEFDGEGVISGVYFEDGGFFVFCYSIVVFVVDEEFFDLFSYRDVVYYYG